MIKWLNKKEKSEKGAISAFDLMSMAFFLIFIVSIFIYFARRDSIQAETLRVLADKYNDKTENDIVSTLVSNEADVIPIYTLEQLKDIGSDKFITIPQADGKIYKFLCQEDTNPTDGSEGRARYKLMQNWTLDELVTVLTEVVDGWESDPVKGDLFVGLENNQALGMYIVNFPNVTVGKIVVKKEIVAYEPRAGQYGSSNSKFVYRITISNEGVVDVDNITVTDIMQRISTLVPNNPNIVETEQTVYQRQSTQNQLDLTEELTQPLSLSTPVQPDGTIRHTENVTFKYLYVKYITNDEDVRNKNTLKNTVTVRGLSSGVSIMAKAEAPEVIYGEQQGLSAMENLVVWFEGIDNMAQSRNEMDTNNNHNSRTTTWYDKDIDPQQSNGTFTSRKNNDSGFWVNGKAIQFRKDGNGNGNRYRRQVEFKNTQELRQIVGSIDGEYSYEFSIQLAFNMDNSNKKSTLYTFGKNDSISSAKLFKINYNPNTERLSLEGGEDSLDINVDIEKGKPYIVVIQGKYAYEKHNSSGFGFMDFEEEYIYSLTWEAYIKDVNADSLTSRKGFIQNFEVISFRAYNDPEDFARFGFGYNLIGKPKGDSGTDAAEMLFYGYKLYNRMLTPEEVTKNVNIDSARLFY